MQTYNSELKQCSRNLRNNMTDAERRLWLALKSRQLFEYQFYRQKIIGQYIVDFYCPKAKLVIELDGGQHSSDEIIEADKMRTAFLEKRRLRVLRYTDTDVLNNTNSVLENILEFIQVK